MEWPPRMPAREYLASVSNCVRQLNTLDWIIVNDGEIETMRRESDVKPAHSDPTAVQAMVRVARLDYAMHARLDLVERIVACGMLICKLGDELGSVYADILEHRYIDLWEWSLIADVTGVPERTCFARRDYACDYIDECGLLY